MSTCGHEKPASKCHRSECPLCADKPIYGVHRPNNLPENALCVSPFECRFKIDDEVIYTNDYGVRFRLTVRGFSPKASHGRFVYIFTDCWWFASNPEQMIPLSENKDSYFHWQNGKHVLVKSDAALSKAHGVEA